MTEMTVPPPTTGGNDLIGGSIRDGWEAFKARLGPVYLVLVIYLAIVFALGFFGSLFRGNEEQPSTLYWIYQLVQTLITIPLGAGLAFAFLKVARGEPGEEVANLFAGFRHFVPVVIAEIIVGIAITVGLILFIIPGIIAAAGLCMAPLLILDRGFGGVDSVKASWAMMKGYKMNAFLLGIVLAIINIIGAMLCGVGLLVTMPVTTLAGVAFYNRVVALNPPPAMP